MGGDGAGPGTPAAVGGDGAGGSSRTARGAPPAAVARPSDAPDTQPVILGLGIDYVEVARMAAFLDRFPRRGPERLFTGRERSACQARAAPPECFAARFAAKEAFLKALGTGLASGIRWTEVELVSGEDGRPRLELSGSARERLRWMGGDRVLVSFSHDGGAAVATVLIEGREPL